MKVGDTLTHKLFGTEAEVIEIVHQSRGSHALCLIQRREEQGIIIPDQRLDLDFYTIKREWLEEKCSCVKTEPTLEQEFIDSLVEIIDARIALLAGAC